MIYNIGVSGKRELVVSDLNMRITDAERNPNNESYAIDQLRGVSQKIDEMLEDFPADSEVQITVNGESTNMSMDVNIHIFAIGRTVLFETKSVDERMAEIEASSPTTADVR
jgi:hypothetical protein